MAIAMTITGNENGVFTQRNLQELFLDDNLQPLWMVICDPNIFYSTNIAFDTSKLCHW